MPDVQEQPRSTVRRESTQFVDEWYCDSSSKQFLSTQGNATICRDFIFGSYKDLKKANPNFPILIREASGVEAKLIARYGESLQRSDEDREAT